MNTLRGTVLRTSSHRIKNYTYSVGETGTGGNCRLSHATPRHICMVHVIIQQQKLHDSCNVQNEWFKVQFFYSMGLQPAGVNQLMTHITFLIVPRVTHEPAAHNNGCGPLT